MTDDDNKEWPTHFSIAGKNAANKYNAISRNINNNQRNDLDQRQGYAIKDFFTPDDSLINNNKYSDTDEETNLTALSPMNSKQKHLAQTSKSLQTKNKNQKIFPQLKKNLFGDDKLKYHNKHMKELKQRMKKHEEPSCTKYNPNMKCIWAKPNTGPQWKTICGRLYHTSYDDKDFYIQHEDISKTNKHIYIDMTKQTMRQGFPYHQDVRVKSEKKFILNEPTFDSKNKTLININNNVLTTKRRASITTVFSRSLSTQNIFTSPISSPVKTEKHILIPDFAKTISRDKLNKIERKNIIDVPFRSPDVNKIKSRPIMMVLYNRNRFHHHKIPQSKKQPSPEAPISYNIEDVYTKINNHKNSSVPNFANMTARPEDNGDPLPSFMKGIYTRASSFATTDKTLQMNNFAGGNYLGQFSSFFPKRSFNKHINLALLNSNKIDLKSVGNGIEFRKLQNFVNKLSRMNKKEVRDLIKENNYYKFDNVSLKHVEHRGKMLKKQGLLKEFLKNLNKEEFS